jgi:oxygen-independent coproporphyrinogen-3 oxidase
MWGVDFQNIFDQHGVDLLSLKKDILVKMDQEGWLLWQDKNLSLSKTGKLLADSIAAALFV